MTSTEEEVLLERILDLDARWFPPRISVVREIANIILATRGETPPQTVGQNWVRNFINRHEILQTKYNRKYDYHRAQCEDPVIIQGWFELVRNTIAKYGILNEDVYNFDETGFQMGVITTSKVVTRADRRGRPKSIQPGNREWVSVVHGINAQGWAIPPLIILAGRLHQGVWYTESGLPRDWAIAMSENGWTDDQVGFEWIQHFNKYTLPRAKGQYRLLVLDGHGSHHTGRFSEYCRQNSIITLCMPPHASHLLQPLDVGCFGPLKALYGKEVEGQMRLGVNHMTKEEFLPVYHRAHVAAITAKNIQSSFRATGLVPYDPDQVLLTLNPVVRTPSPVHAEESEWESKTPRNLSEVRRQAKHIQDQRRLLRSTSRSPTDRAFRQLLKGYEKVAHERAILEVENAALRAENTRQKRKRATRRTFVADGGVLTIQEGQDEVQNREVEAQIRKEAERSRARATRVYASARAPRRCSLCESLEHDSRTCSNRQRNGPLPL